jgi:RNA polymerase sigma factor (TIGR02999 family)
MHHFCIAINPARGDTTERLENQAPHDLIAKWRTGDDQALKQLLPLIYQELRAVARKHLRGQPADHTLRTTALINEAYLRLAGAAAASVRDHQHFVALASRIMRQVLVDHARGHLAAKRQAGVRVTLSEAADIPDQSDADVLAIDEALTSLSELDERQVRVVELRFFGGLSVSETAEALHISVATVKRDWTLARAWLSRELRRAASP